MSLLESQNRWPSLAQDLAIMTVPDSPIRNLEEIYATYDLDENSLRRIMDIPEFQGMVDKQIKKFEAQGDKAASIYRFGTLSTALSEKLFRDAAASEMEAKDAIKLLELLLKAAGLSETKEAAAQVQVNVQNNVGFDLPLPHGLTNSKLAHLKETLDV